MSLDISTKLKLNKANKMDTEAPFISDVDVSITNIPVSYKAYDKRGDLNFNSFLIFRPSFLWYTHIHFASGFTCWISFSYVIQFYLLLSPYICFISFFILIYMFMR